MSKSAKQPDQQQQQARRPNRTNRSGRIVAATQLDRERSGLLAEQLHAQIQTCYGNARKAIEEVAELADAFYCEGVVIVPIAVDHAWIETAEGVLLDPTLALPHAASQEARWPMAYVVARRASRAELVQRGTDRGELPLFSRVTARVQEKVRASLAAVAARQAPKTRGESTRHRR
jgi:hypothetical protein